MAPVSLDVVAGDVELDHVFDITKAVELSIKGRGRNFDLYLINLDGTGQERVTHDERFDGFPMFSPDGKKLVWGTNRHNAGGTQLWCEDTNAKIAIGSRIRL